MCLHRPITCPVQSLLPLSAGHCPTCCFPALLSLTSILRLSVVQDGNYHVYLWCECAPPPSVPPCIQWKLVTRPFAPCAPAPALVTALVTAPPRNPSRAHACLPPRQHSTSSNNLRSLSAAPPSRRLISSTFSYFVAFTTAATQASSGASTWTRPTTSSTTWSRRCGARTSRLTSGPRTGSRGASTRTSWSLGPPGESTSPVRSRDNAPPAALRTGSSPCCCCQRVGCLFSCVLSSPPVFLTAHRVTPAARR